MAITDKRLTGDRGEGLVCQFLTKHGFKIVERNHWRKWGELDIVGIKDNIYHFVEVKTSVRNFNLKDYGEYSPADNVTHEKRRRLSRVVQTYLLENRLGECDWQFDLALVYIDKNSDKYEVEMLEDIDL